MKGASEQAVKVDLALRAVAAAEGLDADEGDLAAEYERMAVQFEQKPNQVRKAYERNDLVPELAAQIRKAKALDWLLHHVELVDPDGDALDRDVILGHTHDEHGGHDVTTTILTADHVHVGDHVHVTVPGDRSTILASPESPATPATPETPETPEKRPEP